MNDLISIIIPCYNVEKTIKKCINSLLAQTHENIEIIAVNDGSTDDTYRVLQEEFKNNDKCILLNQSNSGISVARNEGMKIAKGEYYSFVDADDYVEPDYLEKLIESIKDNDLSICYYSSSIMKRQSSDIQTVEDVFREMMIPENNIAAFAWNRLYKASIIRENSILFNEKVFVCEDVLFNYQYMQYVSKIGICREYLYHYVINSSSTMFRKAFNEKKLSANIAFKLMLDNTKTKKYKAYVEIAAMWFNLILKRQLYRSSYKPTSEELKTINKMLSLNVKAFMKSSIPVKYKLAYPIWRLR